MKYFYASLCGIVFTTAVGFMLIDVLRKKKIKQTILCYVEEHNNKNGTPTMGGLFFIIGSTLSTLLFIDKPLKPITVAMITALAIGITGFLDDYIKISYKRNQGLLPYQKIISQLVIACLVGYYCYQYTDGELIIPFVNIVVNIGYFTIPLVMFVFIAMVNTVNLTDGLDGLCTVSSCSYLFFMSIMILANIIMYNNLGSTVKTAEYSNFLVYAITLLSSLLAFMLFNCYPAKVFMGDTGSLFLGSALTLVAVLTKLTLFIPFLGLPFVMSGVSDIMQVGYFKATHGKRIFKIAPFHHHLEQCGIHENRIVAIYLITSVVVSVIVVATFII